MLADDGLLMETADLTSVDLFADPDARANRVVIQEDPTGFAVYITTERGSAEVVRRFDSESEALEQYIRLLRAQQRLLDRGVI